MNDDRFDRGQEGEGLIGAVHGGISHDLHQRRASAVVVHQRFCCPVIELADVLFEMDACEWDVLVFTHDVARRTRELDLNGTTDTDWLVVLSNT